MTKPAATYTVGLRSEECPEIIACREVSEAMVTDGGVLSFIVSGITHWYAPSMWAYVIRKSS